jgi:ankyrin repeat protein
MDQQPIQRRVPYDDSDLRKQIASLEKQIANVVKLVDALAKEVADLRSPPAPPPAAEESEQDAAKEPEDPIAAFFAAVRAGDNESVRQTLAANPYLVDYYDRYDGQGSEPATRAIHLAARNGYTEIAAMLIDAGSAVNAFSGSTQGAQISPLGFAINGGHLPCVTLLLDHGATTSVVQQIGAQKYGALQQAILVQTRIEDPRPYFEILRQLVLHGANIHAKWGLGPDAEKTILGTAEFYGRDQRRWRDIATLLREAHAERRAHQPAEQEPEATPGPPPKKDFIPAVRAGDIERVQELLAANPYLIDHLADRTEVLSALINDKQYEMLDLMLARNIVVGGDGYNVLFSTAIAQFDMHVLEVLFKHVRSLNNRDTFYHATAGILEKTLKRLDDPDPRPCLEMLDLAIRLGCNPKESHMVRQAPQSRGAQLPAPYVRFTRLQAQSKRHKDALAVMDAALAAQLPPLPPPPREQLDPAQVRALNR